MGQLPSFPQRAYSLEGIKQAKGHYNRVSVLDSEFLCTECHGSKAKTSTDDPGRLLGGGGKQVHI